MSSIEFQQLLYLFLLWFAPCINRYKTKYGRAPRKKKERIFMFIPFVSQKIQSMQADDDVRDLFLNYTTNHDRDKQINSQPTCYAWYVSA